MGNTWNTIVTGLADGMQTDLAFHAQLQNKPTNFDIEKRERVLNTPDSAWRLSARIFNNSSDFTRRS